MATAINNQNSSDIEEYLKELLECPVCMETIKSVPVYQCTNGHVICKDCIKKLNNCPICRNDSAPARSLQLENIVQRLEGIQPENGGPTTAKYNPQKWGKGSVRSYGAISEPIQEPQVAVNRDEEIAQIQREWDEMNWTVKLFLCFVSFLIGCLLFTFLLLLLFLLYSLCCYIWFLVVP